MAYPNGLRSPRDDSGFSNYTSAVRPIGSQQSHNSNSSTTTTSASERGGLTRRFTTNAVPTIPTLSATKPLSPIGPQRRQTRESQEIDSPAIMQKYQLQQEKKRLENQWRERSHRYSSEIAQVDERLKELEGGGYGRTNMSGHLSEPTTPPEYQNGFASNSSRSANRLSLASMSSMSGINQITAQRNSRSGSMGITSPFHNPSASQIPAQSNPTTRRNSDEEEDELYAAEMASLSRRTHTFNRKSMPVTNFDMRNIDLPDVAAVLGTGLNSILHDEDEEQRQMPSHSHSKSLVDSQSLLRLETTHDEFPILVRDGRQVSASMQPSSSSLAADLGLQLSDASDSTVWPTFSRGIRPGHASMPPNGLQLDHDFDSPSMNGVLDTPTKNAALNRRSLDVKFSTGYETGSKRLSFGALPASTIPKLQPSFSTNDIPTLKAGNPTNNNLTHAEQHFHNHNANMGRIPPNAVNRQSRDYSGAVAASSMMNGMEGSRISDDKLGRNFTSILSGNAIPFGPSSGMSPNAAATSPGGSALGPAYNPSLAYNYGMMNMGMAQLGIGAPQPQWNGAIAPFNGHYNGYNQFPSNGVPPPFHSPPARGPDTHNRLPNQRRQPAAEDTSRATTFKMEEVHGRVVDLCKDQHGCRFLQRKIEENDEEAFTIIFNETKDHIVDLMTDPFGNYLCQKLLEHSNEERRTTLINNAAPFMVTIALNQHGTRALQKMIEYIVTQEQINTIIRAFDGKVVNLIQDLNGNHVIQKCLNHLQPENAQFIFDAVGQHCLTVGTHRHGCCVLQRCIDHATGEQKADLVRYITSNAFSLIQDPFGNYVVQYILDLNMVQFTTPLCLSFRSHVIALSKQKFSSNVIEKCLRVAEPETKRILIEEMMIPANEMEKVLRDNFANYVVQTALDFGDKDQQDRMWEIIVPLLQPLRSTPCGRRLLSKYNAREGGDKSQTASPGGTMTPKDMSSPFMPSPQHMGGTTNIPFNMNHQYGAYGSSFAPNIASPIPHRYNNTSLPNQLQHAAQTLPGHNNNNNNNNNQFRPAPSANGQSLAWF